MSITISPIVPLISLKDHEDADEFGILELIDNGYEDDTTLAYVVKGKEGLWIIER